MKHSPKHHSGATLFEDSPSPASTPLMRQYRAIKAQHPNALLLFRMGDFYETFEEDAHTVSRVLGITLTKRANGKAADVALAGFPHHALDNYLPKLIRSGFRVAVCEQLEDPKTAKSIVKRGVTEIVTPGVTFRDELLDPHRASHVASFVADEQGGRAGAAFIEASTGDFRVAEGTRQEVLRILQSISPSEILLAEPDQSDRSAWHRQGAVVTPVERWQFGYDFAYETLLSHFRTQSLKGFGVDDFELGIRAAGAVLHYVSETQKGNLPHIKRITRFHNESIMLLDRQTRRNLDVGDENAGVSLASLTDKTNTPMGARLLRSWIRQPLTSVAAIDERLDAVEALVDDHQLREALEASLRGIGDLERLTARNTTGRSQPRDLAALAGGLERVPTLRALLTEAKAATRLQSVAQLDADVAPAVEVIRAALAEDPAALASTDPTIRPGYNAELDEVRTLARDGKSVIAAIQQRESARTGIPSLKVGYNKVFGYYLEVTNAHKDKVPPNFIRKQTLVNAERYVTPELKDIEERILDAQERMTALETSLFERLRDDVAKHSDSMTSISRDIAVIDALCSFASHAAANAWVRPTVDDGAVLDIVDGRHPVVEGSLPVGEPFIPNSIRVDPDADQILVITGPNMAGKSVVLRQTGIIVLLAQSGSFVPAAEAHVGVVDRIFTRVGASDNLAEGESTFLVEMNEAANILNNATRRSLILLDEVGRGTSTFDGLSIAWAVVEYLHNTRSVAAKTLFATHYHELNELESRLERVRNYRILVQEYEGRVVFLRKLVAGGADHSYGIEVARMAGLPAAVINRARDVLNFLERTPLVAPDITTGDGTSTATLPTLEPSRAKKFVDALDLNRLTPIEALIKLNELKEILR